MTNRGKVKVGIIGSQFEADIHAASFRIMPEEAEVVAVASPTPGHPEALAERYSVPRVFHDYREMLAEADIEMVTITAPNNLHHRMTLDAARAGGGVFMDMGCHGIAFCYWFLNRPKIKTVQCQMGTYVHGDKTRLEDNSICVIDFEGNAAGLVENSWARRGGMEDRIEVYGEGGVTYASLHMGNALPTYSEYGYGYAVEKAPQTKGWSYPVYEELWNYGFPQEMRHFARCVRGKEEPQATGEDGRVVQEALLAGYESAGQGCRVSLPFRPAGVHRPVDLWWRGLQRSG